MPAPPAAGGRAERFTEIIDGRSADLWRLVSQGRISTGAAWSDPAIHFVGESRDETLALQQMAVYRTVRFTGR